MHRRELIFGGSMAVLAYLAVRALLRRSHAPRLATSAAQAQHQVHRSGSALPEPPAITTLPEACQRCAAAAQTKRIDVAIRIFDQPLPTAQIAASALGVTVGQVTNSLMFEIKSGGTRVPVLVCVPGDRRVDVRKLAAALGVSKNKVKGASADAVLAHTGFEAGGVAPCGHLTPPSHTIIDERVFEHQLVWVGGGVKAAMFSCTPHALAELTGGERRDIAEAADEAQTVT